ncbi:ADP-ribosylglycohydrolase family protein [Desulfopila aestuarii]|uniref:ADP-ribosylglycohydrolase n=1 Tax=Desulfopila aestuarii DSM 18488 TaxID=1121416 RepID=A0A1M7XYA6_9BACT|nr:ADP-ribosylglycohydrolase family protein [Desulfopila aestuarii]SHO43991.1 ADP-ribosylglycohydrolase [Desulfopila aestuarii DSM 18488]
MNQNDFIDRLNGALYGMFIGDALAMPVHWYYDTNALKRDYGIVENYVQPRNPHPDSILYRSVYTARSARADILHEQKCFWGQKNIHYHQFLQAGENTLNLKLAKELLNLLLENGSYSAENWLQRLVEYMTTPGCHNDTYVEEYLRHFFLRYGKGVELKKCGRTDEKHIGGFTQMLPVLLVLARDPELAIDTALNHLPLTHGGEKVQYWGSILARLQLALVYGDSLHEAMTSSTDTLPAELKEDRLRALANYPDHIVVGRHFSSACYVDQALPATLYLALKYQNQPEQGLIANTMCGGDNAGRGAVLGALLGAQNGMDCWPARWVEGLLDPPPLLKFSQLL